MTQSNDRSDSERPVAVVTGASSGIGAAAARRLAQRGYRTILMARREPALRTLADELTAFAPSSVIPVDLNDPRAIGEAADAVLEHGKPAVLINCAGVGVYRAFLEQDDAVHRRVMQINYFAAAQMVRRLLPAMIERGSGHVINVGSMSVKVGPWGHGAYAAAKAALVSLTQTLAAEYTECGVHFSYVNPGIVDTPYFRTADTAGLWEIVKHRAISADCVAAEMVGLLDRPRLELCVPRHYRMLDYLRAISPTLAHRIVARGSRCRTTDASPTPTLPAEP